MRGRFPVTPQYIVVQSADIGTRQGMRQGKAGVTAALSQRQCA